MRAFVKALKRQYQSGNITVQQLEVLLENNKITIDEFNWIID